MRTRTLRFVPIHHGSGTPPGIRELVPPFRWALFVASGLALIIALQLTLGAESTDRYFAWTIKPPLTAAFFGAGYFAALTLLLAVSRERVWAAARVGSFGGVLLVNLILLAILLHVDRFHFHSDRLMTRVGTWTFVVSYAVVVVLLIGGVAHQLRLPGGDPPRVAPLPPFARITLAIQAVPMLALGAALFVAPRDTADLWPWDLTPLTGRVTGSWLLAMGMAAALALWENDWWRLRAPCAAYAVFGGLELIALARFSSTPDYEDAGIWLYLALVVSVLVFGVYGFLAGRRVSREAAFVVGGRMKRYTQDAARSRAD